MSGASSASGTEMKTQRWGVVILNWNGTDDTLGCMASVDTAGNNCATVTLSGVVVDNGSQAESLAELRAAVDSRDSWELLRLESNLGFSRGMNAGVETLRGRGISHVLLLNNDTRLATDAIAALNAMPADCRSHFMGMAVCSPDTEGQRARVGYRYYSWLGATQPVTLNSPSAAPAQSVDYVCGSAILCNMAFLQRIHGIPERSFLYFEELRLAKALPPGAKPVYCAAARVSHATGSSADKLTSPSKHYFAAHACYRYTLDYGAIKLPTVALARLARLLQLSILARTATPLKDGVLALWDCLYGVERRPS
jgi:GT2 family glycosyltransferase